MEFLKYRIKFEKEVTELLNICFPERLITKKSFNWKHFPNLSGKPSVAYVARSGKVCAFVCFVPVKVISEGKEHLFYSCSVQATHPEFRRRGLVTLLTRMAEKEIGRGVNYFGFSNENGVQIDLHSKKINYRILGQLETLYYATYPGIFKLNKNSFGYREILNIINYDPKQTQIYKTRDYLKWKFNNNPKKQFRYLMLTKNEKNAGLLIYTKSGLKMEIYQILLKDPEELNDMFNGIIRFAYSIGAVVVSFTVLKNDYWIKNLPAPTFGKKVPLYFTVKSPRKKFYELQSWNVQGGDIQ